MKKIPTTLIVCATIVLCVAILAVAGLLAAGENDTSVGILTGFIGMLVLNLLSLVRGEQTKATVDDLANGRMDAKIRAGVADVLQPHLIDPTVEPQIEADRERRGDH